MNESPTYTVAELENKPVSELQEIARELGALNGATMSRKEDLISRILQLQSDRTGVIVAKGILEILPDGWGFLRRYNFSPHTEDIYVAQAQIKRFGLKTGDEVTGQVRPPKDSEKFYGLLRVESVNGLEPDAARNRSNFDDLTPIYPNERLTLETTRSEMTGRIMDLMSPIGKGQRGMIVAQPKAGKTTVMKTIANSIALNHPECFLIVLLIDERPEEVTDIRRSVRGEVVSSTFDETLRTI